METTASPPSADPQLEKLKWLIIFFPVVTAFAIALALAAGSVALAGSAQQAQPTPAVVSEAAAPAAPRP